MKIGKIVGKIAGIGVVGGAIAGIAYYSKKSLARSGELEGRYKAYYQLANQWLMNRNENKNVEKYFADNNIKTIAVYGMGTLGELFYNEIKNLDIKVLYFIDKNADELYYGLDDITVVGLDGIDGQEKPDAIIVTPVFDFSEIQEDLEEVTDAALVSLEDVIYGI